MTATGVDEFEQQRPRLTGLAYRMLGEIHEAEDAVQDAYVRWNAADRDLILAPRAWLDKVVTNLCLNRLTAARARRETYPGPWLPEPVFTAATPLETAELRDTISLALLTLMERLTPAERAVFVLREAFSYPHHEIAEILDLSEAGSRQLHHRARERLGGDAPRRRFEAEPGEWRRLVERFISAAAGGDVHGLEELLAADVTAWADGGGKVTAARRTVHGRDRVARFTLGIATKRRLDGVLITIEEVNGTPAVVGRLADGGLFVVVALEIVDGRIGTLSIVLNPDKLQA